ncbi:MAG: hypothetical protein CSMARM5_0119 [Candidatus Parvarchaeum acidophilus ARMAN-5_'5-way FS']|jgi:uncharacterized protein YeaO (DUF488 family)|uniref:Uroporphyrin-III C-methyltransferase n=1 Tax=Candidatus Parvarchaeum acidophilus ARMAN-5_'5-way FS' TaxID=994838 RepID=F2UU21_PARA5|nr:MAG: hypothetical protein CSMARM5_0119 [Candidatus Parvarchaeum acidophilus ARMAN-5_'5-way FS']
MIEIARVYNHKHDDFSILVDRVWPRGLKKQDVMADLWARDIAPSNQLRKWFSHDETKWKEFRTRYIKELSSKENLSRLKEIKELEKKHVKITLLFGAKNEKYNQAVVLKSVLDKMK